MSGGLSVQEYFLKNSKKLQKPLTHLTKNDVESEF